MNAPRLLRLPDVEKLTGLRRESIYRLGREGKFPRPVKLTERASAWREDQLEEWINSRPTDVSPSPNPRASRAAARRPRRHP